jgi:hypothetical protein
MAQALPPEIESYRDYAWQRELTQRVETVEEAERFVARAGFAALLTDRRQPGPSLSPYAGGATRRFRTTSRKIRKVRIPGF